MITNFKKKKGMTKLLLGILIAIGLYLLVAWASYSPLDNAWSVASSVTTNTLNKAGYIGAWVIDILFSMFGKVAFIIPFSLILVPSYLLFQAGELSLKQVLLWSGSFILLMAGLSALSAVLFSNTAAYLSGGFVGGMLTLLMSGIGQFGVLLLGALFVALGFYFCSGQVIIHLASRLYEWIVEGKVSTIKEPQPIVASVEPDTQQGVTHTSSDHHNQDQEKLTDVSAFIRPKISGLKPKVTTELNAPSAPNTFEQPSSQMGGEENLPKVTIIEQSPERGFTTPVFLPESEKLDIPPVTNDATHFPKVSLTPQIAEEKVIQNLDDFATQASSIPEVTAHQPSVPPFMQEIAVSSNPLVQQGDENLKKSANQPKVTYPKGYGDSLIHPLLQRQHKVEKPTTPLPTLDLLNSVPQSVEQITEPEIRETSARIEKELANFGVKATVEDVLVGPVVTRYEILPAAGVKASKITNLDSDLARALIFKSIRITDVVPGKPYMGIETPNRHRETVWLRDVLDSNEFRQSKAILPMALGKDISGTPVVVDMTKMPHLLVAGQTGGGKSVGVNTMILSLLFKLTPEQVRFIMIDPKVVELSIYNDIPHLLTPVVTDMKKAENALRWAVEEMERRYLLVSQLGVRNIEGYNDKIRQAAEMNFPIPNPLWRPGDTMDSLPPPLEKMSYIVLIVDEFAELMLTAGKQVEDHIMRIAQKARAVGIHLILATQRPSTDVITGVIKANIPSRIAFTVASQIDSRTILDKGGAETLLGRGDMLYSGSGSPEMIRVHGAFMTDDEVQKVADNWRARGKPDYINNIVESREEFSEGGERDAHNLDPLFDEVVQFMIDGGGTSISGIQRRFSVGFARAARIVDQLEEQGILSAPDNRGKRELLAR